MVSDIPAGDGKIINLFLQCKLPSGYNHTFLPLSSIQVGKGVDQRQHSSLRISLVFTTEKLCSSGLCRFRFPDSAVSPPHLHLHHAGSSREGGGGNKANQPDEFRIQELYSQA
jgi:hypothetical protein